MNTLYQRKSRGFTIIEVVLVLAIAGLILLMVFIALPALQRGQRDTQRRNDVSRLMSQVNSFQTNSRGSVPTAANLETFKTGYLKWDAGTAGEFNDPKTGVGYVISSGVGTPANDGDILYKDSALCDTAGAIVATTNVRNAAAAVKLEGNGTYCADNR